MMEMNAHNYLTNHTVLKTSDHAEASHALQKLICPHRLRLARKNVDLDVKFCAFNLGSIKLGYLKYGASVFIDIDNLTDSYIMKIPVHGLSSTQLGKSQCVNTNTESGAVLSPEKVFNMYFNEDYEEILVCIGRTSLQKQFYNITGLPAPKSINFELNFNLHHGIGRAIQELVLYLMVEADQPDSRIHSQLVRQQYEEMLTNMILTGLMHNNSHILCGGKITGKPRVIQQVVEYMEEHYWHSLTVVELCTYAGINIRSLQAGFKRSFNLTPTEYLRDLRLTKLREKLLHSSIGDSVTTLITECGFTHLSRCSIEYKKRFGESPSETLNKHRQSVNSMT